MDAVEALEPMPCSAWPFRCCIGCRLGCRAPEEAEYRALEDAGYRAPEDEGYSAAEDAGCRAREEEDADIIGALAGPACQQAILRLYILHLLQSAFRREGAVREAAAVQVKRHE